MTSHDQHLAVGAYVLGALDDTEATRFEEHLAGCDRCARELDALMGVEPLLAEFAAAAPAGLDAGDLLTRPGPEMLDRLLGEVRGARRATRTRRLYLVAAAVALIIAGPVVTATVTSGGGTPSARPSTPPAATVSATNRTTGAKAAVAMTDKSWGTDVNLTLTGVEGPLVCELVAVTGGGDRQTVATWSVPDQGYGVPGHPKPLSVRGGTGITRGRIDHFEVRTLDGHTLVQVKT